MLVPSQRDEAEAMTHTRSKCAFGKETEKGETDCRKRRRKMGQDDDDDDGEGLNRRRKEWKKEGG